MASEWARYRLGDAATKIGSGATPRGGKDVYLAEGTTSLIRSQNVHNDGFHHDGLAYISTEHADQLRGVTVEQGDVLLNITGDSVARCCQVDPAVLPARVNQHVAIIRSDPTRLDARFLRYALTASPQQHHLLALAAAGATRNALTKAMLESLVILGPSDVKEQRAIGAVLGALDDKIELNRRMSNTLESTAQVLFKSWFVDFDPVRAKAEGRDAGLPAEIADLFPDQLVDSALGPIPAGWTAEGLDATGTFLNGLAMQKYPAANEGPYLPVIKIAQLRAGHTANADRANTEVPPDYVIADGDILFSWSGSLECRIWSGGLGALNQHLFKVTSERFPKWLLYLSILQHLDSFRHIAAGKATTMGHIQRRHLTEALQALPDGKLIEAVNDHFTSLLDRALCASVEARSLASLRDAFLSPLVSGEVRVPDVDRVLERAVP